MPPESAVRQIMDEYWNQKYLRNFKQKFWNSNKVQYVEEFGCFGLTVLNAANYLYFDYIESCPILNKAF